MVLIPTIHFLSHGGKNSVALVGASLAKLTIQRQLSFWPNIFLSNGDDDMGKFYAVKNGRARGVYSNWSDCKTQVNGFSGAEYKSFPTREAAEAYTKTVANSISGGGRKPYTRGMQKGGAALKGKVSYTTQQVNERKTTILGLSKQAGGKTVIYTDGSSLGNGKRGAKAGWASCWGIGDSRNSSGPVLTGEQTNNRGELIAIHETLKTIDAEVKNGDSPSPGYLIMADSHYARDSLDKWTENWISKGWKTSTGSEVKNRDIIEPANRLLKDLRQRGVAVAIEYVPAHSGHEGNELADLMARTAAETSTA